MVEGETGKEMTEFMSENRKRSGNQA